MDRLRRLQSLWNWLPTFRAVAEHESVSRAAAQLAVSPSAVSRMIGLLESDVGQPLFNRSGRRLELNEAGRHLLAGARSAMRLVDESLAAVAGEQMVGRVRIASREPFTRTLVVPTVQRLRKEHPALEPELVQVDDQDSASALLRGDIDVALTQRLAPLAAREQVTVLELGALPCGVYVGRKHPLAKATSVRVAQLLEHTFVSTPEDSGAAGWWPASFRRRVAMQVTSCALAAEICAAGELIAALPDIAAEHHNVTHRAKLTRLRTSIAEPLRLHAMWREQLDLPGRAEAVVDAVANLVSASG